VKGDHELSNVMFYRLNGCPLSAVNIHREAFLHMPKEFGAGRADALRGDVCFYLSSGFRFSR